MLHPHEFQNSETNVTENEIKPARQAKFSQFLHLTTQEQEHHISVMVLSKPKTSDEWGALGLRSFAYGTGINPKAVQDMVQKGFLPFFTICQEVYIIVNLFHFPEMSKAFRQELKTAQEKRASELGLTWQDWKKSLGYTEDE